MISIPMEVYLDFSLRKKADSIVLNVNKLQSQKSNLDVFYITNKFVAKNGVIVNNKITTNTTFFIRFVDETNNINFSMLKAVFFANVFESDFETMSYSPADVKNYANYYEGHEVPYDEGDWLYFAYCPFGVNKIELLNGDVIDTCGEIGKIWITKEQRGFKRYIQIPKVPELFGMNQYKILKLAIYSIYEERGPQSYSFNLFAPDMKVIEEKIESRIPVKDMVLYSNMDIDSATNGIKITNYADKSNPIKANVSIKNNSALSDAKNKVVLSKSGYLNISDIGVKLKDEFSVHLGFSLYRLAKRGTVLFEAAYGIDSYGNQTHHLTIWLDKDGFLCYNSKYNDEAINTKFKLPLNIYTNVDFIMANVKLIEEQEKDKYMGFIFVNGRQIWPKETYLNPDEKILLTRGYKAYRVYNDVCMNLEGNNATFSYLDVKNVCIKKLLRESGFVSMDVLDKIYSLYLKKPEPVSVDPGTEFVFGSDDKTTIKKMYFGQDSYEDILDQEYYFEGEFYEIAVINRAITRDEVAKINLINALGFCCSEYKE